MDSEMPEQLLSCKDLDLIMGEGCDKSNIEIPSTPGVSPDEDLVDTMRTETLQGPADSDSPG